MNYRTRQGRLAVLGLWIFAMLGLMMVVTNGAQASGKFSFEEPPRTASFIGEAENTLETSLLILKLNMEIFCHEGSASGTVKETGHASVTITFKKCLAQGTSNDGKDTLIGEPCEIADIVAKALALVILHEGEEKLAVHDATEGLPYILFTPDGLTFTAVLNHSECALPELAQLKGSFVASVSNSHENDIQKLISTKGMTSLFAGTLNYGTHSAHLEADARAELTGAYEGWKWGAA